MALRRFTITRFFDMAIAPLARFTVTIIGSSSGVKSHGDGDREEQRLAPVALGEAIDEKYAGNHHQHEADHQPDESVDALVEARQFAPTRDPVGELAEISFRARYAL